MVGVDCGHFYDLTNWVFRHLYMLVPGWFMSSLLTFYFIFPFPISSSLPTYYMNPFPVWFLFWCYFRGTFSGFLGFLGGRPVWFILLFSLLNGFGHLTG